MHRRGTCCIVISSQVDYVQIYTQLGLYWIL